MTQPDVDLLSSANPDGPEVGPIRLNRRRTLGAITASASAAMVAVGVRRMVQAQDETPTPDASAIVPIQSTTAGEMPTTGAIRGAPVGQQPLAVVAATATIPVGIQVAKAQIDAQIEVLNIVNGSMENPTGPWVVSWYLQTAELGEIGNVVLAGHVDYWNVGPSVFYSVGSLAEGDEIVLTGANNATFTYVVSTNDTFGLEDLTSGKLSEVVNPTPTPALTMITCGGEFDYVNGEYLSRTVVRSNLKS
jgi:hypothetical protein